MHLPPETEVIDLRAPSPAGELRRDASEPEQEPKVPAGANNEGTDEGTQPPAAVEGADGPAPALSTPSLTLTGPDLEFAPSTHTHEDLPSSPSPPPLPEKDAPGSPVLTLTPANSDFALKMAMMGLRTPAAPLPPSPPLTPLTPGEGDISDAARHAHVRQSWVEDDLETASASSSSQDDESSGPSTKEAAVPAADDAIHAMFAKEKPKGEQDHPLSPKAGAGEQPSPPLWERVDPPSGNGNNPYGSSRTRVHDFSSTKPLYVCLHLAFLVTVLT